MGLRDVAVSFVQGMLQGRRQHNQLHRKTTSTKGPMAQHDKVEPHFGKGPDRDSRGRIEPSFKSASNATGSTPSSTAVHASSVQAAAKAKKTSTVTIVHKTGPAPKSTTTPAASKPATVPAAAPTSAPKKVAPSPAKRVASKISAPKKTAAAPVKKMAAASAPAPATKTAKPKATVATPKKTASAVKKPTTKKPAAAVKSVAQMYTSSSVKEDVLDERSERPEDAASKEHSVNGKTVGSYRFDHSNRVWKGVSKDLSKRFSHPNKNRVTDWLENLPEHFVYSDKKEPFTGDIRKINPNNAWKNHMSNHYFLNHIEKNTSDARERIQAGKEKDIASKKMSFWEKHPHFNRQTAERDHAQIKKDWNSK